MFKSFFWLHIRKSGYNSKIKDLIKHPLTIISPKIDFQVFLEKKISYAWSNRKYNRHLATHTAPILLDITDEDNKTILLDFIGRIENVNSDFEYICKKIGLSNINFPNLNNTNKKRFIILFFTIKKIVAWSRNIMVKILKHLSILLRKSD